MRLRWPILPAKRARRGPVGQPAYSTRAVSPMENEVTPIDASLQAPPTPRPAPGPYVGLKFQHHFNALNEIDLSYWDDGIFHVDRAVCSEMVFQALVVASKALRSAARRSQPSAANDAHLLSLELRTDPARAFDKHFRSDDGVVTGAHLRLVSGTKSHDVTPMAVELAKTTAAHLGVADFGRCVLQQFGRRPQRLAVRRALSRSHVFDPKSVAGHRACFSRQAA